MCNLVKMSHLRLLTFDVTNTILKVKISPSHHYAKAAMACGLNDVKESQLEKVYRSVWHEKKRLHPNYGAALGMTTREWWFDFVRRVFASAGYGLDATTIRNVTTLLWDEFERGLTWEVLPNSHDVLSRLKILGIRLGVVSNFDERLAKTLAMHGLDGYFDFLVTSVAAGAEKPDPAIYRYALSLCGGTKPGDAGHVGDDVANDYLPARSVGMTAFLLNRNNRLNEEDLREVDRSHVIGDLTELEKLLFRR